MSIKRPQLLSRPKRCTTSSNPKGRNLSNRKSQRGVESIGIEETYTLDRWLNKQTKGVGREKGRAAQGWQFYASVIREGTGSPIKLPIRKGEEKGGEVPNEGRKKGTIKKTQNQNKTKQNPFISKEIQWIRLENRRLRGKTRNTQQQAK